MQGVKIKVLLVSLFVCVLNAVFFAVGYLVTVILGIPFSFGFGLPIRLLGVLVLASGFLLFGWLFKCRRPVDVLVSTYVTISKMMRRVPLEKPSGRTEPLVIQGPHRYVRHPLYLSVVVLWLGWWLLLDYSSLLVSTILLLLWVNVVASFEEKELRAIFREQYEQYSKEVPRIIPFTKHQKK